MTTVILTLRYAAFAVLATCCNLAMQRLALAVYDGSFAVIAAVLVGTATGLVVKYLCDKWWIFRDLSSGIAAHARRFSLYTLMGVGTTAIFWSTELAFWFMWRDHTMREIGAVIGLAAGYTIKYQLDKHFVFARPALAQETA